MFFRKLLVKRICDHRDRKAIQIELEKIRSLIMATKADVLQAIADEKAQVTQAITDMNAQIQALKDQIANGTPVTAADLDEIASAVHDIFVPAT